MEKWVTGGGGEREESVSVGRRTYGGGLTNEEVCEREARKEEVANEAGFE
jgi:hypothetical protein